MSKEAMKLALEAAYIAGWNASGEGYNAEYPFGDHAKNPEEDAVWVKSRDNALRKALAEQPAPVQGWETVPVEPTVAMIDATGAVEADMREMVVANWKEMLAAAPQPAQQELVATVIEELEHDGQGFCAKVRWLHNPVPVGETLSWEQPK